MPYTVIKTSEIVEKQDEVVGEFRREWEAREFAEYSWVNDPNDENKYSVESPPSVEIKFPLKNQTPLINYETRR